MKRRTLLGGAGAAALAGAGVGAERVLGRSGGLNLFPDRVPTSREYGTVRLEKGSAASDAPDVLFLSIDDMNDWAGFLNAHPGTLTPNLDALAAESLSFTSAHCSAPMCMPSRTSVLFGQRPDTTGVVGHDDRSDDRLAMLYSSGTTLVDDVWAAGYHTSGAGKVFHSVQASRWDDFRRTLYHLPNYARARPDAPLDRFDASWRSPYDGQPITESVGFGDDRYIDWGPSGPEADHPDGDAAEWLTQQMGIDRKGPRFFGLGIVQPHLPWRVPQRFLDMHPLEEIVVPEIRPDDLDDLGPVALGIIDPQDMWEQLTESGLQAAAIQAYQAAITFVDHLVGQVLNSVADSNGGDDTAIVIWSDHGYHLGEKLHLRKFTLWERSTRVPLLLKVPGTTEPGSTFEEPVSLLDLAPTVRDICGAEAHIEQDGVSLFELLDTPSRAAERPPITVWGEHYSVRTATHRLIRYGNGEMELYDSIADPDEFTNLIGTPEAAGLVSELERHLPAQ